jgi:hypothetical protein
MASASPLQVRVRVTVPFGDLMGQIRVWLDDNKVQLASFRSARDGDEELLCELVFRDEQEALRLGCDFPER